MRNLKFDLRSITLFLCFSFLTLQLFTFEPTFIVRHPLSFVLFPAVILQLCIENYPNSFFTSFINRHAKILILSLVLILVGLLFGKNVGAQWGPIDDHEIISQLGTDQKLRLSEIPQLLLASEAGLPGITLRYRPVYQTIRIFEIAAWGNHAQPWYIFRLVMLISALSIIWYLLYPRVGFFTAGLLIIFSLTYQMWADMFARLGPSETYTVLGLAIYLWGFSTLVTSAENKKQFSAQAIMAWFIGTFVCVGSKENFVLLLMPNTALAAYFIILKNRSKLFWFSFIILSIWTFFVGGAFMTAVLNAGTDIYGRSVATTSRISILNTGIRHNQLKIMFMLVSVIVTFITSMLVSNKKNSSLIKSSIIALGIISFSAFIFLSQYIFYNGDWPNHSRYDFPGVLVIPLSYSVFLLWLYKVLESFAVAPVILKGLRYGFIAGLVCITIMRGFVATQVKVADNVTSTQRYTAHITKIANEVKAHPEKPIVIESGNLWDYEPVYANSKFLRAYGVTNTLHLRLHNYAPDTVAQGLEKQLATELLEIQNNGGGEYTKLPAQLSNCYSLQLIVIETECELLKQ